MLGPPLTPLAGPASTLVEGWWTSTVRGPRDVIPDGADVRGAAKEYQEFINEFTREINGLRGE